jgi:hypothetical protein
MRKVALTSAAVVVLLGLVGVVSIAATPQAAAPSTAKSKTLSFDVTFSPFILVPTNPVRPSGPPPFAAGDEILFHDTLLSHGVRVGDELGSCVVINAEGLSTVDPEGLSNCTEVIRLSGGTITAQFANAPPPQKQLAVTGGTGIYRNVGGEGTLLEFGNGKGSLTLHLLSFSHDGQGG